MIMEANFVDPRTPGVKVDAEIYRVYFWSNNRTACEEWQLHNAADVHEVLHWSTQRATGREVEIFAEVRLANETTLIRLVRLSISSVDNPS